MKVIQMVIVKALRKELDNKTGVAQCMFLTLIILNIWLVVYHGNVVTMQVINME